MEKGGTQKDGFLSPADSAEIGIIGGTGAYDPKLLKDAREIKISTPFGTPSDSLTLGTFQGRQVAILPRHGRGHTIPPHMINFRANIWALKELGCKCVLATAACGSLRKEYRPGDMVIPDQFIDLSRSVHTFYEGANFYHVGMAEPFCPETRKLLVETARGMNIKCHPKGIYIRIEGPQFSTKAASEMYQKFADIIGMTIVPEAILSREKAMCFGAIATITDYDSWIGEATPFEEMKKTMAKNLENTKRVLQAVISKIPKERKCICKDALKGAEA